VKRKASPPEKGRGGLSRALYKKKETDRKKRVRRGGNHTGKMKGGRRKGKEKNGVRPTLTSHNFHFSNWRKSEGA